MAVLKDQRVAQALMGLEGRGPESKWARSAPYPGVEGAGAPWLAKLVQLYISLFVRQFVTLFYFPPKPVCRQNKKKFSRMKTGLIETKLLTSFLKLRSRSGFTV